MPKIMASVVITIGLKRTKPALMSASLSAAQRSISSASPTGVPVKTALSGGGYGVLNLMVENNSGLYEGSIISCVAISLIPLILWLTKHGTIFPPDWRVKLYAYALIFACLLIPVGTSARTGLLCIALLAVLMLRVQAERMNGGFFPSEREYSVRFGLNERRLALLPDDDIAVEAVASEAAEGATAPAARPRRAGAPMTSAT